MCQPSDDPFQASWRMIVSCDWIEAIESEALLERVRRVSGLIRARCIVGPVTGVQGAGLLLGLRTARPAREIHAALLERNILAGTSADPAILRLLPPFILDDEHVELLRSALLDIGGDQSGS